MPELPEVEITKRNLERWLKDREVVRAEADKTRIFRGSSPKKFDALKGRLAAAARKGKYLLLEFDSGLGLLAHLGMTGKWVKRTEAQGPQRFSRARVFLDDGTVLHYQDARLFGRIEPVPREELWSLPVVQELGRDPLADGLDARSLKEAIGRTKLDLKVALMDQGRIAGLGNIHAAEALYRANLHPGRKAESLTDAEWKKLVDAIHETIRFALESEDDEEMSYVEEPGAENPFLIYGRAGEKCRKCSKTVKSFTQGGRTTHFCPGCQPAKRAHKSPGNR